MNLKRIFGAILTILGIIGIIMGAYGFMNSGASVAGMNMNMVTSPDMIEIVTVGKVWHIMCRAVIINLLIIITIGVFHQIINTTHGNHTVYQIRPF